MHTDNTYIVKIKNKYNSAVYPETCSLYERV